jgi:hypothetical protein
MATLGFIGFLVLAGLFPCPALADEPLAAAGIMAPRSREPGSQRKASHSVLSTSSTPRCFQKESKIVGQR